MHPGKFWLGERDSGPTCFGASHLISHLPGLIWLSICLLSFNGYNAVVGWLVGNVMNTTPNCCGFIATVHLQAREQIKELWFCFSRKSKGDDCLESCRIVFL